MKQNNYDGLLQQPLHSGFDASTTAKNVIKDIDLTGKTAIITGGNTGIGLETAKVLAAAGATVFVTARDSEKAKKNLQGLSNITFQQMDLADERSIDHFAQRFLASGRALQLLINNAGIMWAPLQRDNRGIESHLAINYLGHFQLTARLWPALKKANGARVVNVSSFGHQFSAFDFEDPNFLQQPYDMLQAYGQSKTATNLFAVELDTRGQASNVRAYSLHPGAIDGTDLAREAPMDLFKQLGTHDAGGLLKPEVACQLKTIPQGAATTVWCATSQLLINIGGVYCEDADIAELDSGHIPHRMEDYSTMRGVQPYSVDKTNAKRLWKMSEEMTGLTFRAD